MNRDRAPQVFALSPCRRKAALAGCSGMLALALALGASPAAARAYVRYKPLHREAEQVSKEPFGNIPKGPLQIIVSIDQQKLHLYSGGASVADTAVATGVPRLPTPTGVFSVIEKDRYHHSNIYSGAPMPFMQRITWSGVALHEGENIGHPASHGCIRMPHDFAVKLWVLTKLGVRVIVAKPELKPIEFADSHLFIHKVAPPIVPAPAAAVPTAIDGVKTAQAVDGSKANDSVAAAKSNAPAVDSKEPAALHPAPAAEAAPSSVGDKSAAAVTTAKPDAPITAEATTGEAASTDAKTPPSAAAAEQAETAKPSAPAAIGANELKGVEADPVAASVPAADTAVPLPPGKPAKLLEATAAAQGPIAIFISRKTQRIYVRQHFAPLFDAPVTIADPGKAFGTLIFTALNYLDDGTTFRWNLVSMPAEAPKLARIAEHEGRSERYVRGRRRDEPMDRPIAADPTPPETPAEVLARITIPQDVLDRISELMVPGSSLVVSDQGLGGETGEGTDFIVVTH